MTALLQFMPEAAQRQHLGGRSRWAAWARPSEIADTALFLASRRVELLHRRDPPPRRRLLHRVTGLGVAGASTPAAGAEAPWLQPSLQTHTERVRATWYRLRIELRSRWKAWSALALIVGLTGGAVLALAAGARRTDSSYRRFLHAQDAYDVQVSANVVDAFGPQGDALDIDRVATLPHVAAVATGLVLRDRLAGGRRRAHPGERAHRYDDQPVQDAGGRRGPHATPPRRS